MYPRIRDLREDANLSQTEFAKKIYLQRTTYVRYESGARELPMNIAILIADYHNVTLDYLVGRTPKKKSP